MMPRSCAPRRALGSTVMHRLAVSPLARSLADSRGRGASHYLASRLRLVMPLTHPPIIDIDDAISFVHFAPIHSLTSQSPKLYSQINWK